MKSYIDEKGNIYISEYVGYGTGLLKKRNCLPLEHPESEYNQLIMLGLNPKDYGYDNIIKCPHCNKLIKI